MDATDNKTDGLAAEIAAFEPQQPSPEMEPESQPGIFGQSFPDPDEVFDSRIHACNPDGSPRKTKEGKYYKKKGPKPKPGMAAATGPVMDGDGERRAAAATVVQIWLVSTRSIFGDEWEPRPGEQESLIQAWDDYFLATGTISIPPSVALIIAMGLYAGTRLHLPQTREKIKSVIDRVKGRRKKKIPIDAEIPGGNGEPRI